MCNSPSVYVVAGCRPWSQHAFENQLRYLPGNWHYVSSPQQLTKDWLLTIRPRYIFFLHWNWIVPKDIVSEFECVCFHMTDLPFGRGGSPLQHLILAGHKTTQISALRMVEALDAGPIYLKRPLSLQGSAQEIYERSAAAEVEMVRTLIEMEPSPQPQVGEPTYFRRRQPGQSQLPQEGPLEGLYDFIRMLDADGYPHAFFERGEHRYEFRHAQLMDGKLTATVSITPTTEKHT